MKVQAFEAVGSQRRFLQKDSNILQSIIQNHYNQTGLQRDLFVPVYIHTVLSKLIFIDINTSQAKCFFRIFFSIITDHISQDFVGGLHSQGVGSLEELKKVVENNLTIELGRQFIDIFPSEEVDDDQPYNQQYFIERIVSAKEQYCTYAMQGIFKCDFNLENRFFPYHVLNCSLSMKVLKAYYKDIKINYYPIYPQDQQSKDLSFYIKIQDEPSKHFGIYRIQQNLSHIQYYNDNLKVEMFEECHFACSITEVTKNIRLNFKIECFNVPFLFRSIITLWVMSIVSFMLFYITIDEDTQIYENTILISIAVIFLMKNFRSTNFKSSVLSIYEINILLIIFINFAAIINFNIIFFSQAKPTDMHPTLSNGYFIFAIVMVVLLVFNNILMVVVKVVRACIYKKRHVGLEIWVKYTLWMDKMFKGRWISDSYYEEIISRNFRGS